MPRRLPLALALLLLSCTGEVLHDEDGVRPPGPGDEPGPGGSMIPPGTTVLHRLNRVELANTLDDLFGEGTRQALPNGSDPHVLGFDSIAAVLTVSHSGVDLLVSLAERVSKEVGLDALANCDGLAERACIERRLDAIGPRVLRRPLESEERSDYLALWEEVRGREDAEVGTRAVLKRLLISPDFLYHVELGDPATGLLTPYELASRLSYLLWESMPDETLLEAARTGALASRQGVRTQLERLAADPRGRATLTRFFAKWSDFEKIDKVVKDPEVYPGFDALRPSMKEEFRLFVDDVLTSNGTVGDLLASTSSFVDPALAEFYGVNAPSDSFAKVDLSNVGRAGLFTQAAFLTTHGKANKSSPILRGVFVRERLLCSPIPPPPPTADNAPTAPVTTTTREYFAALTAPNACNVCHKEVNPIGFAFEGYDGVGRSRDTENGYPVDTSGAITSGDMIGEVDGAWDLVHQLAASATVRDCIVKQWFRSRARRVESSADQAIIEKLTGALSSDGDRIRALVVALSEEDAFYRPHFRAEASR